MAAASTPTQARSRSGEILAIAALPARLTVGLAVALPVVLAELPPLVRNLRRLVGQLARLAEGIDPAELSEAMRASASRSRGA